MNDSTIAAWLLDHIWAPVMGLLGLMVKNRFERIEQKADAALPKAEFERHLNRSDRDLKEYFEQAAKQRDELRDSVLKLFDRFDELKTLLLHHQPPQPPPPRGFEQRSRHD